MAVAAVLGVSPPAVSRWVNAFDRKGNRALDAGKRGRRPGEQKALNARQEARVRRVVLGKYPDQVALPGLVWTARRYASWPALTPMTATPTPHLTLSNNYSA